MYMEIRNSKTEMPLFKVKGEKFIFAVQMKLQGKCRVVGENRMEKIKLTDICNPKQWKTIPTSELLEDGYPVYGANGIIGYYSEFNHKNPVITVTCRGATCGTINITVPKSYVTGNAMCLDDVRSDIYMEYLYYCLKHYNFNNVISGSAQPQITRQGMEKIYVTIGSHNEQMDIVDKLKKVENVIGLKKQELKQLDTFVKSRFVELFGNVFLNTMKWEEHSLELIADIVSGITKGRKMKQQTLMEVPYMAVSNVKDGYIDWTTIKTIEATEQEINQYRLLPNDVLMTEGGDPDKVGRGAIIRKPLENCIHQNHIFRVRLNTTYILPEFFAEYLQHQRAKRYFLRCAKQTTGIASINMKQLRALPVLIPPIELQNQFADFVVSVDKSKSKIQKSLQETQLLFDSLMQKYFG